MAFAASLDELVIFELPNRTFAEDLLAQLSPTRFAWMEVDERPAVVAVLLTADYLDLAVLLRTVQSWLARIGLIAIRMEVDGKVYVLDAVRNGLVVVPA